MSISNSEIAKYFKIITFILLFFLVLASSWATGWHPTLEINLLVLFLCAYVLLLVLPITKFKLGPSGFEGELKWLTDEKGISPPPSEIVEKVDKEVAEFSQNIVESDLMLMRLSIEIETTLRNIAELSGLTDIKVGLGQLTRMLQQKEIITNQWLFAALQFFQVHRNELIHEGKTSDIQQAIDVGRLTLAKLRQIQKEIKR
jgi:hypothetical protein